MIKMRTSEDSSSVVGKCAEPRPADSRRRSWEPTWEPGRPGLARWWASDRGRGVRRGAPSGRRWRIRRPPLHPDRAMRGPPCRLPDGSPDHASWRWYRNHRPVTERVERCSAEYPAARDQGLLRPLPPLPVASAEAVAEAEDVIGYPLPRLLRRLAPCRYVPDRAVNPSERRAVPGRLIVPPTWDPAGRADRRDDLLSNWSLISPERGKQFLEDGKAVWAPTGVGPRRCRTVLGEF
jgi:hypothetical protein